MSFLVATNVVASRSPYWNPARLCQERNTIKSNDFIQLTKEWVKKKKSEFFIFTLTPTPGSLFSVPIDRPNAN